MSTKACHLEVVTSLHEEACLAAIARSCTRPGQPTKVFYNATKFLTSRTDLDTVFEIDAYNRHIKQNLSTKAIDWLVIPVHAPHSKIFSKCRQQETSFGKNDIEITLPLCKFKKWFNDSNNFNMGKLVLVAGDNCRVLDWPVARNTNYFNPGNDTCTHAVEGKTAKWYSNRTIDK